MCIVNTVYALHLPDVLSLFSQPFNILQFNKKIV